MVKIEPVIFDRIWGTAAGKTFKTYADKRRIIMLKRIPAPSYTRTSPQDEQRTKFEQAVSEWNSLSAEQKQQYEELAKPLNLTGYQYFIHEKLTEAAPPGVWYKVTIDNTGGGSLSDYQILIDMPNDTQFFEDCNNAKEAIRIYDNDRQTSLPYWIEEWDTTNHNARIWVKVPSIPAGGVTYIYISIDPSRTEDASNADAVFDFFDDFSNDLSKWDITTEGSAYVKIENGRMHIKAYRNQRAYVNTKEALNIDYDCIIELYAEPINEGVYGIPDIHDGTYIYVRLYWYSWYSNELRIYDGGTYHNFNWDSHNNYPLKIICYTQNKKFDVYLNNNLIAQNYNAKDSSFSGIINTIGNKCGASDNGGEVYFDNIIIRKYADPEPSISYQKET